jgi:predicted phage terminase large subunit-like protein
MDLVSDLEQKTPETSPSLMPSTSDELQKLLDDGSVTPELWREILSQANKELAPTDPFAYGEYVFQMEAAPHHREMVNFVQELINTHRNGVILEPRGHAKTTWANTIFLSWLIANNPNIRIGIISNTAKQSNAFSRAIRWTLQQNEYFHELFGDLTGPNKWTDVEWIRKDSLLHGTKDVSVYSTGAPGAVISKRFDLILCDDILDEENTASPEQQEKIETWFWKTLKPALVPGGSIVVIGTRWAEGDLYQKLMEDKKWPFLRKGAIFMPCEICGEHFFSDDALNEHYSTRLSCSKGTKVEKQALWPAVWPMDKLEQEKRDMGSAMFACSYLNDISGLMEGNIFKREWMQYFRTLPEGHTYRYKMGVDLASSEREEADYTARAIVAEDENMNIYVLSVYRDKRETGHRQFVLDGYNAYPLIERILVENNQFQSTLVTDLLNTTRLPIIGKRADVDKVTRARAVAARYEAHKVFHHESMRGSDFEIELLQFPRGHDDMIDSLGHAMETGGGAFWYGKAG